MTDFIPPVITIERIYFVDNRSFRIQIKTRDPMNAAHTGGWVIDNYLYTNFSGVYVVRKEDLSEWEQKAQFIRHIEVSHDERTVTQHTTYLDADIIEPWTEYYGKLKIVFYKAYEPYQSIESKWILFKTTAKTSVSVSAVYNIDGGTVTAEGRMLDLVNGLANFSFTVSPSKTIPSSGISMGNVSRPVSQIPISGQVYIGAIATTPQGTFKSSRVYAVSSLKPKPYILSAIIDTKYFLGVYGISGECNDIIPVDSALTRDKIAISSDYAFIITKDADAGNYVLSKIDLLTKNVTSKILSTFPYGVKYNNNKLYLIEEDNAIILSILNDNLEYQESYLVDNNLGDYNYYYNFTVKDNYLYLTREDDSGKQYIEKWEYQKLAEILDQSDIANSVITVTQNIDTATPVYFELINGTLPTGLSEKVYYAINVSSTEIKLAETELEALSGISIDIDTQGITGNYRLTIKCVKKVSYYPSSADYIDGVAITDDYVFYLISSDDKKLLFRLNQDLTGRVTINPDCTPAKIASIGGDLLIYAWASVSDKFVRIDSNGNKKYETDVAGDILGITCSEIPGAIITKESTSIDKAGISLENIRIYGEILSDN